MTRLSSTFGKFSPTIRSREPLSDEIIRQYAPSIFAENAHESRSARYAYIPTSEVLSGLRREGFEPFMVAQTKCRDAGKIEHTKHMIRLRHAGQINDTEANEIILLNSHDGTSSYQMIAGMFRFVCMNGLVCGETFADVRVRHKGNPTDEVIEGAYTVLDNFAQVTHSRDEMRALQLSHDEARVFADAALALRYDSPEKTPLNAGQILRPRRAADAAPDLWATFNVVQENLIRGGLRGLTTDANGRARNTRSREVSGIAQNTALNRALWTLAEGMKALKAA